MELSMQVEQVEPESNHELMLRAYVKKHSINGENLETLNHALAKISVKNHGNAIKNKYAQFQRHITVDQVLNARKAAQKPLGLYDFAPISDGASALILTSEKVAKGIGDNPVFVLGCTSATDYLNYPAREDLSHFIAAELALKKAVQMSKVKPLDLQIIEVYDQSTVLEMVLLEDLGFCVPGTAWKSINESYPANQNYYEINGRKLFVNTDGGLKANGNPLGATGGAQIYEIFRQLRGEAGDRQVNTDKGLPKQGCAVEFEGFGTKAYVTVLGEKQNEQ
jgi:acetyl-CoA C-acetyltransferase